MVGGGGWGGGGVCRGNGRGEVEKGNWETDGCAHRNALMIWRLYI